MICLFIFVLSVLVVHGHVNPMCQDQHFYNAELDLDQPYGANPDYYSDEANFFSTGEKPVIADNSQALSMRPANIPNWCRDLTSELEKIKLELIKFLTGALPVNCTCSNKPPIGPPPPPPGVGLPINYQGYLLNIKGKVFCTGAIIGERYLITTAGCVKDFRKHPQKLTFKVGRRIPVMAGKPHRVTDIFIHPKYDGINNNIAVIRAKCVHEFGVNVDRLRLPIYESEVVPPTISEASVYNVNDPLFIEGFRNQIQIADKGLCLNRTNLAPKEIVCASWKRPRKCGQNFPGDSLKNNKELVGVLSEVSRCKNRGIVYVNVKHYVEWILEVIKLRDDELRDYLS